MDFSNGTSDAGVYVGPTDVLWFYPLTFGTTVFTDTTWHQVVLTRDATTQSLSLYLDGNLENTFADTGSAALLGTNTKKAGTTFTVTP